MANKQKILLQLDCDPVASSFDAIVAVDSGVDHLLTRSGVTAENVQGLVHGAMFTRGGTDLASTAIFLGGSNVAEVDRVLKTVQSTFFGPVRISVMADPNGCNTTAVAAVLSAQKHQPLSGKRVVVPGGTGPVGSRIATLAASAGSIVTVVSRDPGRADQMAKTISGMHPDSKVTGAGSLDANGCLKLVQDHEIVFAAGAAGVQFLADGWLDDAGKITVAIDCNAVPPAGLAGISPMDRGKQIGAVTVYGPIGIGGLKMKIHKRCIEMLFERNDQVLDLAGIMQTAGSMS